MLTAAVLLLCACSPDSEFPRLSPGDSLEVVRENEAHRAGAERFFLSDPDSPFQIDTTVAFTGLRWFPIDPRFRGRSILHRYEHPETVRVMGTRGDERKQIRFGWFAFAVPDEKNHPVRLKVNAYRAVSADEEGAGALHLSVWFTDRTTGRETYHVGRYVEVGNVNPDADYLYTIDLNKAFNPFCAYSDIYTCAVPRREDHLDIALRVGEMTYDRHRMPKDAYHL
jgi:uncharacterized protein